MASALFPYQWVRGYSPPIVRVILETVLEGRGCVQVCVMCMFPSLAWPSGRLFQTFYHVFRLRCWEKIELVPAHINVCFDQVRASDSSGTKYRVKPASMLVSLQMRLDPAGQLPTGFYVTLRPHMPQRYSQ